ncbi:MULTISPECIES: hypothetical protein [unclassified Streptomyces]|uniref:hypothetical protein n=1 Tax=unclassified Streptomyces TaxID=2593676 RepID=UPI0016601B13|nr:MULTISPECIES: hypothetical protein [unclassified Streptomyces]MBD0711359.1 hypothetical protein [Streptomyces sp. CBMA291]MBD0718096.1 hypothetical protein [Streptomyces sp. CBMA370]
MSDTPQSRGESAAAVLDEVGARYEEVFADVPGQLAALEWLIGRLAPGATFEQADVRTFRPPAGGYDAVCSIGRAPGAARRAMIGRGAGRALRTVGGPVRPPCGRRSQRS